MGIKLSERSPLLSTFNDYASVQLAMDVQIGDELQHDGQTLF